MGGKIAEKKLEFISIVAINIMWLFLIAVWFLSGFENEIGSLIRTYCFGYGAYGSDVIISKTISMILPPAVITAILTILFFKSEFFRRGIFATTVFLIILLIPVYIIRTNMVASPPLPVDKEIPTDIKFLDIEGNIFNFSQVGDDEYILTFFYISCHGSCPLIIYEVKRISLKSDIPIVMVSLNPADDVKKLRAFYFENGFKKTVKIIRAEREDLVRFIESLNLSIGIPEKVSENPQIIHPVLFIRCKGNKVLSEVYGLGVFEKF